MEDAFWPEWLEEVFDNDEDYREHYPNRFNWDFVEDEDEVDNDEVYK